MKVVLDYVYIYKLLLKHNGNVSRGGGCNQMDLYLLW